jgi:hypothetical protein
MNLGPWRRLRAPVALAAMVGVAFACWLHRSLLALHAHQLQWGQDFAFFHQIFHNAASGRPWSSSLLLEPLGFLDMVHLHLVIAPLVPIYALFPHAETLLVFNVAAVALSALPVVGMARACTDHEGFALLLGLAWLLWLPTEMAALADFRPMVFFLPGFLWLLEGVLRRSWGRIAFGILLCVGAREEAAYLLLSVGIVLVLLPFGGWRRREGLVVGAAGLLFLAFLLLCKANFFYHFDPRTFFRAEGPPLDPELTRARVVHLGLLVAGGFLPVLLCPAGLAACAGPLAYLMFAPDKEWHIFTGPYAFYRDALLPFVAAGAILGWGTLLERASSRARWLPLAAGLLACVGNVSSFAGERIRLLESVWRRDAEALASEEHAAWARLLGQISPQARVATDYRFIAALSGRDVLWNTVHLEAQDARPRDWPAEWPIRLDRVDTLLTCEGDPILGHLDDAWTLQDEAAGYTLWIRIREPVGGFPEPLP